MHASLAFKLIVRRCRRPLVPPVQFKAIAELEPLKERELKLLLGRRLIRARDLTMLRIRPSAPAVVCVEMSTVTASALAHRFCLVAPGDFASTHKLSEAMAIGGAGGCIPVFAVYHTQLAGTFPYTRWLRYCDVGYLVVMRGRETDGALVRRAVERLALVTEAEAARNGCV